ISEPGAARPADVLPTANTAAPAHDSMPARATPLEPTTADLDQESFVEPTGRKPVESKSGSEPVAFGSLLETPADEKDDDMGFLPSAHPELSEERDWRDPDADETDEEETTSSWRPEKSESYAETEPSGGAKDWHSGSIEQILARKPQEESWGE